MAHLNVFLTVLYCCNNFTEKQPQRWFSLSFKIKKKKKGRKYGPEGTCRILWLIQDPVTGLLSTVWPALEEPQPDSGDCCVCPGLALLPFCSLALFWARFPADILLDLALPLLVEHSGLTPGLQPSLSPSSSRPISRLLALPCVAYDPACHPPWSAWGSTVSPSTGSLEQGRWRGSGCCPPWFLPPEHQGSGGWDKMGPTTQMPDP